MEHDINVSAFGAIPGGGLLAGVVAAIEAVPTMPQSGKIMVNHENILGAAKIIHAQIDSLQQVMLDKGQDLLVQAAGGDTVSQFAAEKWNDNLLLLPDSYAKRVQQYIDSLTKVVGQMRDAAVQYGFTEDEITESFGKKADA